MALKSATTTLATIQMRRGAEENFDPDQLTAGEWAVSTDSKKVWMCFHPGLVLRMATYEAFEKDMEEIRAILIEAKDIQKAIEKWNYIAESYAHGGTGKRDGEDTDNAKYYSEQAKLSADKAESLADIGIMTVEKAGIGKPDGETITVDEDGTMHAVGGGTEGDFASKSIYGDNAISLGRKAGTVVGDKSISYGNNNEASNAHAFSVGYNNAASGDTSFSAGWENKSLGLAATSFGNNNVSVDNYSFSEGCGNIALGYGSHAENCQNIAGAKYVFKIASYDSSSKTFTFDDTYTGFSDAFATLEVGSKLFIQNLSYINDALIYTVSAKGSDGKTVTVNESIPTSNFSLLFATIIKSSGNYPACHAEGRKNIALGNYAHAEGYQTETRGRYSHAEGYKTQATADKSHAEGGETKALDVYAHAEGYKTEAGFGAHAEGYICIASGYRSHAGGYQSNASGENSFCHGKNSSATNKESASFGNGTIASGECSFCEGGQGTASGIYSHAEGYQGKASGSYSHVEGYITSASGEGSHAEGWHTTASKQGSHAEGFWAESIGQNSHVEGYYTKALSYQHAQGIYNDSSKATTSNSIGATNGTAFVIGNGTSSARSNAARIDYNGKLWCKQAYSSTGADYAELFEWADGNFDNEDRRGYFVTMDGKKIKKASEGDYIVGIISGNPSVIGNTDMEWYGQFMRDEFGTFLKENYKETMKEPSIDDDGKLVEIEKEVDVEFYKVNPDYDPDAPYTFRLDRPEWDAVGMLGVLPVRDDGTCEVGKFCKCADGGIATLATERGFDTYMVIERVNENVVSVVLK